MKRLSRCSRHSGNDARQCRTVGRAALPGALAAACLIAAWLAAAAPVSAQEPSPARFWTAVGYEHSRFRQELAPWHLGMLEAGARNARGAVLVRGSVADRFGERSGQAEFEAYPFLSPRMYGMVNAGVSDGGLFPRWQAGAELYGSPAHGLEVSAGVRHMAFAPSAVTLLTGSAGLYAGDWHVVGRPFLLRNDGDFAAAGFVTARRLLGNGDEWLGVRISGGSVPARTFTESELGRTGARGIALEGRVLVRPALLIGAEVGHERESLPNDLERSRVIIGTRLEYRFQ